MKNLTTSIAMTVLFAGCISKPQAYPEGTRIATYDARAVTIAYANSEMFDTWLKDLQKQRKAAKSAGDEAKIRELENLAQTQQKILHNQTFGNAGIGDILEKIKPQVQSILTKTNADRLGRIEHERPQYVETVDVTDMLVAIFEPDERARGWIRDIRKKAFPKD